MLGLIETRVKENKAQNIIYKLGVDWIATIQWEGMVESGYCGRIRSKYI